MPAGFLWRSRLFERPLADKEVRLGWLFPSVFSRNSRDAAVVADGLEPACETMVMRLRSRIRTTGVNDSPQRDTRMVTATGKSNTRE